MTSEEKAYIAGIIDGEGNIMLLKFHYNQFPSPCISIISSILKLLEWIRLKTGAGTIKGKKNYNSDEHKDSYTYVVKYDKAIELLKKFMPYLIIESKRKRAFLILEKYKKVTPRNGRYSPEMLYMKTEFYDEFMAIK